MNAGGPVRITGKGLVELAVLVSAGSSRAGVRGVHGETVKVAVRSAPERGRANREVEEVVAEWLGVRSGAVKVSSGGTSRRKILRIAGVPGAALIERLSGRSRA
jgi:uncharacterized protein